MRKIRTSGCLPGYCLSGREFPGRLAIYRPADRTAHRSPEKTNFYDKSFVVITGDHEHITCNLIKGMGKTLLSDRFVPLIILNALYRPVTEDAVIGQSDIYPTILI